MADFLSFVLEIMVLLVIYMKWYGKLAIRTLCLRNRGWQSGHLDFKSWPKSCDRDADVSDGIRLSSQVRAVRLAELVFPPLSPLVSRGQILPGALCELGFLNQNK